MDMSEGIKLPLPMKKGFGATDRVDDWWKGPTAMAAYLGIMIVYATWRGFMEADFWIFDGVRQERGYPDHGHRERGQPRPQPTIQPSSLTR